MYSIPGHHHISMITKDINRNNHFYTKILGLRRVKISVNQDDPSMYHLFYGDLTGSPGTGLTFFEMPYVGNTYRGTNAITRIGLRVASVDSLHYWKERLETYNVKHGDITTYFNRPALHFEDDDGLQLVFVVDDEHVLSHWQPWDGSPVPATHQIQGFGPVEIKVRRLNKLTNLLTEVFHYKEVSRTNDEVVLQSIEGESFGEIVAILDEGMSERPGRGSIHHVAIRVRNEDELKYWLEQVRKRGFVTTGIVERHWFKSVYFRESNGVMIEMATDGPGFMADEDVETLGTKLVLPPYLEHRRSEIEANLTPIDDQHK